MPNSDPQRRGILALLDFNSALATPAFQRSFAWKRAQVDEYWTDLLRALDVPGGQEDYFLGLVVLDEANQIQDGQQRLATTLLLASAMYEQVEGAKESGNHDPQTAIDASAPITQALRSSPSAALTISAPDQQILLKRTGIRGDLPESAKRLVAARKRLKQQLHADLSARTTPDSKLGRLKQWGEFLRSRAYVVVLRVPAKAAHNIFETLNTRGVRLSNGDLVKSHLIANTPNTDLAVNKWNAITSVLTDQNESFEEELETFLLHYYGSRYERTTKAEFFTAYRKKIEGADGLVVLDELIESAGLYRAIFDPAASAAYWAQLGEGTQQAVELLNGLGLKQLRYLLLSVLRDFAANQNLTTRRAKQRQAVLKIAAWSIRALVHGRAGGAAAEGTYIKAATEIRSGGISTVDQLKQRFIDRGVLIVDDNLFKERFKNFQFDQKTSHKRARAVLHALEYHKISTKAGLKPKESLTVEHVLPRSPGPGQWALFTDDQRRVYTYMLGNLLLIDGPSKANLKLGNKEWHEKQALIQSWGNQTPLTTEALGLSEWSIRTIESRNDQLAELAVEAWCP